MIVINENPILYAISILVAVTPWYVIACVPFLKTARLPKKGIVGFAATSVLLKAIAAALLLYSLPDTWRNYSAMLYIGHLCIVLCIYIACFRLTPLQVVRFAV